MIRNFSPFILALLGLQMIFLVSTNALLEWQISEIVTDLPASYKMRVSPSPWRTRISDVLSDKAYVVPRLSIRNGDQYCSSRDLDVVVKRSRTDELLERLLLLPQFNSRGSDWRIQWALIEVAVSMVYLIGSTLLQKPRTFTYIVISWIFAIVSFCLIMISTMKSLGPRIGLIFDGTANCQGIITISAELAKVHYSVLIAWLAGILAELGALVIMVRQMIKVIRSGKESSNMAVG